MKTVTHATSSFFRWLFGLGGMKRTLLVPYICLIVGCFGIAWGLYMKGSRDAVFEAMDRLVVESASRVRDRIEGYLASAIQLSESNAAFLRVTADKPDDLPGIRKAFRLQLLALPDIDIVSIGFANGEYVEAQRLPTGMVRTGSAGEATGGDLVLELVDEKGNPVSEDFRRPNYDPRARPWYRSALLKSGANWSAPYPVLSTGDLTMAATVAIIEEGRVLGVTTTDLNLRRLSKFLAESESVRGGFAFIIDAEGRLVAASDREPILDPADHERRLSYSARGERIASVLEAADSARGRTLRVKASDGSYRAIVLGLGDKRGLDWRIAVAYPEAFFIASLEAIDFRMGAVLLLTLTASVLLAFIAAYRVAEPLRRLGLLVSTLTPGSGGMDEREAEALARRDDEIGKLSSAFIDLSARLESSFEELRSSLREKEILLKEVHHRVKNNLQIVSSLMSFQSGSTTDAASRESLERLQERIQTMAYVHEDVYGSGNFRSVSMARYFQRICESLCSGRFAGAGFPGSSACAVETDIDAGNIALTLERAIPCGLIVNELVANALKHAFVGRTSGSVRVELAIHGDEYRLIIEDDGIGLGPTTETRTASPRRKDGTEGIGSSLVAGLAAQLRGNVEYKSSAGRTVIIVRFPAETA